MNRGEGVAAPSFGHVVVLACAAIVILFATTGRAEAGNFINGSYFVVDGRHAGTELKHVNGDTGHVSAKRNKLADAHGFVRPPNDTCRYPHFEGFIGGKKIKASDCVRVSSLVYGGEFGNLLSGAIDEEMKGKKRSVDKSQDLLDKANDLLPGAIKAGKVTEGAAGKIADDLEEISKLDKRAEKLLKENEDGKADKLLDRALKKKHQLVDAAPSTLLLAQPPVTTPLDADFTPASFSTTYTETASSPEGHLLKYQWTLIEHNDFACVDFEPNQPTPSQAIWRHPDSQCNHALEGSNGHVGTIIAVVTDGYFSCPVFYDGSNSGVGPAPAACVKNIVGG